MTGIGGICKELNGTYMHEGPAQVGVHAAAGNSAPRNLTFSLVIRVDDHPSEKTPAAVAGSDV